MSDSAVPPRKLLIRTHGCQMNVYDSTRIAELLGESHGFVATEDENEADLLLLNTCSIREKAQEKVFSQIGRWQQLKAERPGLMIGVGGCVASQEGEQLRARAPAVDLVFGPQTLHRLPELLNRAEGRHAGVVDVSFPEIEKFDRLPLPRAQGPRAFVSIMEGCSKYCSFCVVPYTRGEEFSRPLADVLTEVAVYAAQGVREVTLLGQNVNAYQGVREGGGHCDFAALLHYVAEIEGIGRIRYTTSHPLNFTPALVRAHAQIPALARHVHLPVQSGSDRVLAAMKRNHRIERYHRIIDDLRAACPDLAISSDFIVGFPGEDDDDFEATMELIERVRFDQSFSFIYSARPGTPAADLPDTTPAAVKQQRLERLQARINAFAAEYSRAMLGRVERVLVDGHARKNAAELSGRTENNRVVNFAADDSLIGHFVELRVTDVMPNSLRGELAA